MNSNKQILFALMMVACSQVAQAAEWSLTSTLNPSATYDDNVFLRENAQSSTHYAMSPTITGSRTVENSDISLSLGYQIDRYTSLPSINDTENPFIRLNSYYNAERSQYGLSASYVESTSRSTALLETGDFATQSIYRSRTISPSYSYQLTERDSLSLNGSYSERLSSSTQLSDTETKSISAGWQRQLSERLSAGVTAAIYNYKSDGLTLLTDDDDYNLSTTFNYALSELWNISGAVGLRKLKGQRKSVTIGITTNDNSSGTTLDFSAIRTDDINSYSITASRALIPTGRGDVNQNDSLSVSWAHHISDQLTANLVGSYYQSTSAIDNSNNKRKNINISPSLRWQLERNLSLNVNYTYRKQTQDSGFSADSNAIGVTLNYNWDGIRISR